MLTGQLPAWVFYAVLAYFAGFLLIVGSIFFWRIRRRKERPPEKFKLLRGPGETLRRRVQKADEDMFLYLSIAAFGPLFLGWGILVVAAYLPRVLVLPGAAVALVVFGGALIASG